MIKKSIVTTIALLSSLFVFLPEVNAGVTCTGQACTYIPADVWSELQTVDQSFKTQYTDKVLSSMADASVLTNLNSGLVGKGFVNRFEVGFGATAAGVQKDDITITHGKTVFPNMPNAGISFSPVLAAGVNLGWLLGRGKADTNKKKFLHRINLYVHGFSYKFNNKNVDKYTPEGMDMGGLVSNFGTMVRFQLVNEKNTKFNILGFNGLSVGAGVYMQNQSLNIVYHDQTIPTIKFGSVTGSWAGDNKLDYQSKIRSYVFDVRTGIRLFYFITLFTGIGTSVNTGSTELNLERTGIYRVGTDLSALSSNPDFAKYLNSANTAGDINGQLSLAVKGSGRPSYRTNYILAGTELNVTIFKILVEAYAAEKTYSATVGFKFSF